MPPNTMLAIVLGSHGFDDVVPFGRIFGSVAGLLLCGSIFYFVIL
jgi:hypothetical protein